MGDMHKMREFPVLWRADGEVRLPRKFYERLHEGKKQMRRSDCLRR